MTIIKSIGCITLLSFAGFASISCSGAEATEEALLEDVDESEEALRLRRLCGGPFNLQCRNDDQFCDSLRPGRCPGKRQLGVCRIRPDICTDEFDPVCGCDGVTYPNACNAAAAGVAVESRGECAPDGEFCGGIAGFPCPEGQTCIDDPSDDCDPNMGGADCGGICVSERCGDEVCGPGLVCCNPLLGICTPPGGVCIF